MKTYPRAFGDISHAIRISELFFISINTFKASAFPFSILFILQKNGLKKHFRAFNNCESTLFQTFATG
jgi:hypothetical protein